MYKEPIKLTAPVLAMLLTACGGGGGGGNDRNQTANDAPVALISGAASQPIGLATFSGSGSSDPDGDTLSYQWSIEAAPQGSSANLSDPTAMDVQLFADALGSYTLELVVYDGELSSSPVSLTLELTNLAPVANAGNDQSASVTDSVTLNGSGSSDADGQPLTYLWDLQIPAGSSTILDDPTALQPSFVVDAAGDYVATLTVSDGFEQATDSVTVSTQNSAPQAMASASALSKQIGAIVTLDGTASSDVDGDSLSFNWQVTAPDGSTVTLIDADSAKPSFEISQLGDFEIRLTVSDGSLNSDAFVVLFNTENSPPQVELGDLQEHLLGSTIELNASVVDSDSTALTYAWSLLSKPAASALTLASDALQLTLTPDVLGDYLVQLLVSDGVNQVTDTLTLKVVQGNLAPVANAGPDQSFTALQLVTLDASASSDPEGDALSYSWSLLVPENSLARLDDNSSLMPSFTPDINGVYKADLVVSDGDKTSAPDSVIVTLNVNGKPVANAGDDLTLLLGQPILLNGSQSSDPDAGDPLAYRWSVTSQPENATATFNQTTTAEVELTVDSVGQYRVQLEVDDGKESGLDDVLVTVADGDQDSDGLNSSFELAHGLDPNEVDSNGDGVSDGDEDFDNDGLTNRLEAKLDYDPRSDDSDANGIKDGDEDYDSDGVSNIDEVTNGTDPAVIEDGATAARDFYLRAVSNQVNFEELTYDITVDMIAADGSTQQQSFEFRALQDLSSTVIRSLLLAVNSDDFQNSFLLTVDSANGASRAQQNFYNWSLGTTENVLSKSTPAFGTELDYSYWRVSQRYDFNFNYEYSLVRYDSCNTTIDNCVVVDQTAAGKGTPHRYRYWIHTGTDAVYKIEYYGEQDVLLQTQTYQGFAIYGNGVALPNSLVVENHSTGVINEFAYTNYDLAPGLEFDDVELQSVIASLPERPQENRPPVVDVSNSAIRYVTLSELTAGVWLDEAIASDEDGDTLTYEWDLESSPSFAEYRISPASTLVTVFTANAPGTYVLVLAVSDGEFISKDRLVLEVSDDYNGGGDIVVSQEAIDNYNTYCIACHGTGVAGAPKTGDTQAWVSVMAKGFEAVLENTKAGFNGHPSMGLCGDCSDEVFIDIIEYMSGIPFNGQYDPDYAANFEQVALSLALISTELELHKTLNGDYPTTAQGLAEIGIDTPDPWGNQYVYTSPGQTKAYELLTYGSDGAAGGVGTATDISVIDVGIIPPDLEEEEEEEEVLR